MKTIYHNEYSVENILRYYHKDRTFTTGIVRVDLVATTTDKSYQFVMNMMY